MFCAKCRTENKDGALFCKNCGAPLETKKKENVNYTARPGNGNKVQFESDLRQTTIPDEYKPISMWGYFGYQILFAIPILGIILLIICAITASNVNLKNFARSYFCFMIIVIVVFLILTLYAGVTINRFML